MKIKLTTVYVVDQEKALRFYGSAERCGVRGDLDWDLDVGRGGTRFWDVHAFFFEAIKVVPRESSWCCGLLPDCAPERDAPRDRGCRAVPSPAAARYPWLPNRPVPRWLAIR
jgi:hypothetical protein